MKTDTKPDLKPLKIIGLEAEGIKRIRAVSIKMDGSLVQITGKNGQGKTSILDAIWWTLAGAKHIQTQPIRTGATEARVKLDMGDVIVTRTIKKNAKDGWTTGITVTGADGSRFPEPQAVLNSLLGALSLDPLDFVRRDPKAQFDIAKAFVPDLDFDAIAEAQAADAERRTEIGREQRRHQGAADAIVIPATVPDAKHDIDAIENELVQAAESNAEIGTRNARRADALTTIAKGNGELDRLEAEVTALNKRRTVLSLELASLQTKLDTAEPLPNLIDTESLRARLAEARQINALVDQRTQRAGYAKAAAEEKVRYDALTSAIEHREASKQAAIAAAKIPVVGLSFGDGAVLLNGLPFDQASDAEQLRASIEVAMALSPRLHVIRVRDGSLLDADSMKIVADMATARDYLVIMERVEPSAGVGMIVQISDGMVVP